MRGIVHQAVLGLMLVGCTNDPVYLPSTMGLEAGTADAVPKPLPDDAEERHSSEGYGQGSANNF